MSSCSASEQADIYKWIRKASSDLEVTFDAEGAWIIDDEDTAINKSVAKLIDTYKLKDDPGRMHQAKVIAAIAFCDGADLEVYDYARDGGGVYEDD